MDPSISAEVKVKACNYFMEGYNCAESVFLTFREILAPDMDPSMVKLMTGFGGGVGRTGCMCGALSGAIISLDMLKGRTSNQESREEAYQSAREFSDRFREQYGVTCCRALNKYPYKSKEHMDFCREVTGNTSKMLMEYILEKELIK